MWYFTWVLGLGLAVTFGILNGIWHEFSLPGEELAQHPARDPAA
jgi:cyd operon protein YbgT